MTAAQCAANKISELSTVTATSLPLALALACLALFARKAAHLGALLLGPVVLARREALTALAVGETVRLARGVALFDRLLLPLAAGR